ncbi:hypothetical protein EPI10_023378 [Gossypium australe]|uniref:Retrovirus-related Pol polyprotein from transposon TNT 1-94 n=1 Tax=Gossypium australe TaxID=47621 RepID=A0A5B6VUR5_9ROSI|nr:hypothetical protein EPI10_023378 [Gossypium australe]
MDDIIATGNDSHAINQFVKELNIQFSLKDLKKYILDLLRRASMDKSKGSPMPTLTTCNLSAQWALYNIVITRPGIAFSANKVCQFMHKPLDLDFKVVKRILCYLEDTLDHGLCFTRFFLKDIHMRIGVHMLMIEDPRQGIVCFWRESSFQEFKKTTSSIEVHS